MLTTARLGITTQEDANQALADLISHLAKGQEVSRASRKIDLEGLAKVVAELRERLDEQQIHWHPDRASPVGVATKQTRGRLRWLIVNSPFLAANPQLIGMVLVIARYG